MRIFNTEQINKILKDYNDGKKISRTNNPFYRNILGTLNYDIKYVYTNNELSEYTKCSHDILYFIETYCNIKLRGYQKEWIEMFINNRFNIYCTSRQTGYSQVMAAVYLHFLLFNPEKTVVMFGYNGENSVEFLEKIWKYYLHIPYFLKCGIKSKNIISIQFNNGSKLKSVMTTKNADIGYDIDILSYTDFSRILPRIINEHYKLIAQIIKTSKTSRIHIQSQPNGFNLFYNLINNSLRKDGDPLKNVYKTIKTYWWEVDGRDSAWKEEEIKNMGGREAFDQEYDLQFFTK